MKEKSSNRRTAATGTERGNCKRHTAPKEENRAANTTRHHGIAISSNFSAQYKIKKSMIKPVRRICSAYTYGRCNHHALLSRYDYPPCKMRISSKLRHNKKLRCKNYTEVFVSICLFICQASIVRQGSTQLR